MTRFRAVIEHKLGLSFQDDKLDFLTEILRARLEKTGEATDMYLALLESPIPSMEWSILGELLTVPETYFFRHYDQFRAFAEVALPDRMRARSASGRLSILSAGCASGEEAYSLAVLTREATGGKGWDVSIVGVDINPAIIRKAIDAHYSSRALRQTSPEMQQKLFGQQRHDYVLDESVRKAVRFEERNLIDDDPNFWQPESFDIIFCRNVIIYFSAVQAQALVSRFTRALAPGGYLFLGHAENLRGLSQDFHVCHTHDTFYYRRRSRDDIVRKPPDLTAASLAMPTPLEEVLDNNGSWVEAIRSSAERVQSLAEKPASTSSSASRVDEPRWSLAPAFDLLRNERFHEALDAVRGLPAEAANDVDAVLLHAVLCAHSGKLDEAEKVCRHLLDLDELNAGAQYVLALCREGAGDDRAAISHDQTAIYLDPGFAMPHLHLGLLARRGHDLEGARRELQQALILLQREELARLLLFGGGFGREALLALCRAELIACGGQL
ncbi:MAG TPA: CheR family methyltransferase [Phototrophicaceae bacterium]|nr:CheR family methyltransferase [Phototrophicaceae bacterium]